MAKKGKKGSFQVSIGTKGLDKLLKNFKQASTITKPIIAKGLNEAGSSIVTLLASKIAQRTGLTLGEVRGAIKVKRAGPTDLKFAVTLDRELIESPNRLEGRRENEAFGGRRPGTLVIVVSRKDELVCMDCQELEAAGPMPVEVAMAHIPKHPNCRCIIMPWVQKGKRLPVTMQTLGGDSGVARSTVNQEMQTLRQITKAIMDKSASKIVLTMTKE